MLIHAGAGGSGSAAIQLAAHAGAHVFAPPATDDEGRSCAVSSAPHVAINYTTDDFAEVVLEETGDTGVDVIFDNVG